MVELQSTSCAVHTIQAVTNHRITGQAVKAYGTHATKGIRP
jgi:hypothetical protein